jgi:hypothetical protein
MRNALTYASIANRNVAITLMLLSRRFTRFGHILKLLIQEVTGVLMTDRYPARCQETTVSGLTRMSASDQLVQIRRTTTQNRRSNRLSLGPRLFAFIDGELLSKGGGLHCQMVPRNQEPPHDASIANRAVIITPMLIALA